MTCDLCSAPCNGKHCKLCGDMKRQEDRYGVPSDHFDEEGGDDD